MLATVRECTYIVVGKASGSGFASGVCLTREDRASRQRYLNRVAKERQHYAPLRKEDSFIRTACGIEFDKGQMGNRPKIAWIKGDTNCKRCKGTEQYRQATDDAPPSLVEWIGMVIPQEAIVSEGTGCNAQAQEAVQ